MYRPVLVTAPTIKPVTLAEVKVNCRASEFTDDDTILSDLIDGAISHLDGWTGILARALCEQTWRQDFDYFRPVLRLPLFPVISVSSVKYTDTTGTEQTVASENYSVQTDDLGTYVQFVYNYSAPPLKQFLPAAVRVTYVAGYADVAASGDTPASSSVPRAICRAMILHVRMNYDPMPPEELAASVRAFNDLVAPFSRKKF